MAAGASGGSALVALRALHGAVDRGAPDHGGVEDDPAVLGGDVLRGGGLLGFAPLLEVHQGELTRGDLDQRELVALHREHGVAQGVGLALAPHDLGGEGGLLAVQRDHQGAGPLVRGDLFAGILVRVAVGASVVLRAALVGRRRGLLRGIGGLDALAGLRRALLRRGAAGGEGEDEGGDGGGGRGR